MGGDYLIFDILGSDAVSAPLRLQLHGMAERDGSAAVHGTLVLREGRVPTVLVATGTGGTAACADADGDGLVGVVALTAPLREARTGEVERLRITATEGHDLDAPGRYPVTIAIGDQVMEAEMRVDARWVGAAPRPR